MSIENESKINKLLQNLPKGAVATSLWLHQQGINAQLVARYEKSHWLQSIGHGAYIRSGDEATWQSGVFALQSQLSFSVHIGGKTALELAGYGHFIPAGDHAPYVYLFSDQHKKKLPQWFLKYHWESTIFYKQPQMFNKNDIALTTYNFSSFEIKISAPERAILELLYLVPSEQGIDEACLIIEGMLTLRADVVQELLERCCYFKVKRLFLALAEEFLNPLFVDLNTSKISLGNGKISIVKGGYFNKKYNITLPKKSDISNE